MKLSSKSAFSLQEHPKSSQNTNINRLKNVKLSSKAAFSPQEHLKASQNTDIIQVKNVKLSSTSAFNLQEHPNPPKILTSNGLLLHATTTSPPLPNCFAAPALCQAFFRLFAGRFMTVSTSFLALATRIKRRGILDISVSPPNIYIMVV